MAPSRRSTVARSTRARVSYRETSSDEDSESEHNELGDELAPVSMPTRSKRTRASKPKLPDHPKKPTSARRTTRVSYKEPSSESSSDEDDSDKDEPASKRSSAEPRRRQTKRARRSEYTRPTRNESVNPVKDASKPLESDGIIPPWAMLPYEILLQIMTFASYPLHNDNFLPTPSVSWLLNTARVCKSFAEPALTALYRSPPLWNVDKPHMLVELLSGGGEPAESRMFNYNVKVKRLEFDVVKALAYTATGRGLFDLGSVIPLVPQLSELQIYNHFDKPQLRTLHKSIRWHYPESLFSSLRASGQRLKSWRWNEHLTGKTQTLRWIEEIHRSQSFQSLQQLALINYGLDTKNSGSPSGESRVELLATAISSLPDLKSLVFETSPIVNEELLPLLPTTLVELVIDNCISLTSEALQAFLITHGSQVKTLVLNHNQSLDVSFLPDLKRSCPRLEVLKMDLKYYNSHATHNDSDPKYEDLLKPEEIPTWPHTLRTLEMIHLRNWSSAAAETFFGSLVNSAEELPDLRRLVLKAILNIGWRDRAKFRDEWIGKLQAVFLRRSPPPNPHLMSLRAFRLFKKSSISLTLSHVETAPLGDASHSNENAQNRQLHQRDMEQAERLSPPSNDSDQGAISRRLRPRIRASAESLTNTEPSQDDLHIARQGNVKTTQPTYVQGMCEVVDINIDNLRPREEQYNENDFLDSEASGDEDWNGNDDVPGAERYAW